MNLLCHQSPEAMANQKGEYIAKFTTKCQLYTHKSELGFEEKHRKKISWHCSCNFLTWTGPELHHLVVTTFGLTPFLDTYPDFIGRGSSQLLTLLNLKSLLKAIKKKLGHEEYQEISRKRKAKVVLVEKKPNLERDKVTAAVIPRMYCVAFYEDDILLCLSMTQNILCEDHNLTDSVNMSPGRPYDQITGIFHICINQIICCKMV